MHTSIQRFDNPRVLRADSFHLIVSTDPFWHTKKDVTGSINRHEAERPWKSKEVGRFWLVWEGRAR